MITVTIEQKSGKGRVFQAALLAYARADAMWEGGRGDTLRPIFAQFACSDQEERPFVANLQAGYKAKLNGIGYSRNGQEIEFLKSANYVYASRGTRAGKIVTVFIPDLLLFDQGLIDPVRVRFVLMPDRARIERESAALPSVTEHVQRLFGDTVPKHCIPTLSAMAALFCGALSRRTPYPILADMRFQAQVYLGALRDGLASWSRDSSSRHEREFGRNGGFFEHGVEDVGLHPGVAFFASQERIGEFLASEIKIFREEAK